MRTLLFVLVLAFPLAAQVGFERTGDNVQVTIDGHPFTTLYAGKEAPKPYLHPLRSASGKQITRGYPMEPREGDPKDHQHHRGLWYTHGDINGTDFWMNEFNYKGTKKGILTLTRIDSVKPGSRQGSITMSHEWKSPAGELLMTSRTSIVFYARTKDLRMLDYNVTLTPVVDVTFGDTKEGTFALRLTPQLQEDKGTGKMTNAEGKTTERQVWGKRSPWVDYAGTLDGEALGVAMFDHPSNPHHPTYWHSRAYGLFALNAYGVRDFERDKTKDGSQKYQAGKPVTFRYRVVIHPGDTASANLAKLFEDYKKVK
jgi:hypothetical protein